MPATAPVMESAKPIAHEVGNLFQMAARERYHHLDAVRAFALLLGIAFHSAESFGPNNHYWAIVDCSPSEFLEDVRFACHAFRLELFYVMCGFFARLLLLKRGTGPFVRNRTSRILVPLVVGWVIIYPLLVLIWLWGKSVTGELAQFGVPADAARLPIVVLWLGFFMTGGFLQKFDLTHLWFLHQLLALYALMVGAVWVGAKRSWASRLILRLDSWFVVTNRSRWTLFCLALPTIPMLLLMRGWSVDTPKESIIPYLPTTILYGFFFLAGWLWHRRPELLEGLAARCWHYLVIGVLVWVSFGAIDGQALRQMSPEQIRWVHLEYVSLYALMMWAFVLGFIGLFTRFCRGANPWIRYIAEASYWMYLAHLPLVVALQVAVGRVQLPWGIKVPFIAGSALLLLLLSYHYCVRGTFIGAQLNGQRYPVRWPWQNQRG